MLLCAALLVFRIAAGRLCMPGCLAAWLRRPLGGSSWGQMPPSPQPCFVFPCDAHPTAAFLPAPALPFCCCRIVSLLDIFEIDNNTFATVLELVQGGDLDAYCKLHEVRAALCLVLCMGSCCLLFSACC